MICKIKNLGFFPIKIMDRLFNSNKIEFFNQFAQFQSWVVCSYAVSYFNQRVVIQIMMNSIIKVTWVVIGHFVFWLFKQVFYKSVGINPEISTTAVYDMSTKEIKCTCRKFFDFKPVAF